MRILFLSSDPISIPCLQALGSGKITGVEVSGVICNPDQRKGRGKKMQKNPVAEAAESLGLPILQTSRLTAENLVRLNFFDAALVFAFGQILSRKVLDLCPGRFLNFHASPLPLLRGASPIESAIAEGWDTTGVCLMQVTRAMDAGPVGARMTLPIQPDETGPSLREKIATRSVELLENFSAQRFDSLPWKEQDHGKATYCRKLCKADAGIDFSLPAREVFNRFRAFAGWPGTSFSIRREVIKVDDLRVEDESGQPGQILAAGERLQIATGRQSISIGRLQRPTKKMLPFAEFQKQAKLQPGQRLSYRLSRPLTYRR